MDTMLVETAGGFVEGIALSSLRFFESHDPLEDAGKPAGGIRQAGAVGGLGWDIFA